MTDTEKLRSLADSHEAMSGGAPEITAWVNDLRRIAGLLDAVPPETLAAIKAGAAVVVPAGFARFLKAVMESAREFGGGDVDGGWIQDYATDMGILIVVQVTEPCGEGENCVCTEYGFPVECYRYSPEFKAMRSMLTAAPKKPEG